jgi:hypothetical protein
LVAPIRCQRPPARVPIRITVRPVAAIGSGAQLGYGLTAAPRGREFDARTASSVAWPSARVGL